MAPVDGIDTTAKASPLWAKYSTRVDNQSAREMLAARMEQAEATAAAATGAGHGKGGGQGGGAGQHKAGGGQGQRGQSQGQGQGQGGQNRRPQGQRHTEGAAAAAGGVAAVTTFLKSREGKKLQKQVTRGLFGLLKKQL
jgi:hypothetical protein